MSQLRPVPSPTARKVSPRSRPDSCARTRVPALFANSAGSRNVRNRGCTIPAIRNNTLLDLAMYRGTTGAPVSRTSGAAVALPHRAAGTLKAQMEESQAAKLHDVTVAGRLLCHLVLRSAEPAQATNVTGALQGELAARHAFHRVRCHCPASDCEEGAPT